jgi:hypothetical protein
MMPDYLQQLRSRARRRRDVLPRPMCEVVTLLQKSRIFRTANRLERFQAAWKHAATDVLGPNVAAATAVESHAKGELKVVVESQALVREIATFHAKALVEKTNQYLDGKDRVSKIRAKYGLIPRHDVPNPGDSHMN